jgi:hypothetical protein
LNPFFVEVLDDVFLVEGQGRGTKPCHVSLLTPFDTDAFEWASRYAPNGGEAKSENKSKDEDAYLRESKKILRFVIDAHLALDSVSRKFVFVDVKLENLLLKTKGMEILEIAWGDLESLRPFPCVTPLRYTLHYLPPALVMPTLAANTAYLQGRSGRIRPPPPRCFRKAMLAHQVAILASCLLIGGFPPSEIWWALLEERKIGECLLKMVKDKSWWNDEWSPICQVTPFLLASAPHLGMTAVTYKEILKTLEAGVIERFKEDMESFMELCKDAHLGPLDQWSEFIRTAFQGSMKDLRKTDFLA